MKQVLIDRSKVEELRIEVDSEESVVTLSNIDTIKDAAIKANVQELIKKLIFKTQDNVLSKTRISLVAMNGCLSIECKWLDNLISATRSPNQTTWDILLKEQESDNAMEFIPPIDDMFDTFARWTEGLV